MIIGIGTDILNTHHLSSEYLKPGDPFLEKTYSPKEIRQACGREQPFYYYATRFAGKEAVFKSLGIAPQKIRMSEIEILNDTNGIPHVTLYGDLKQKAGRKGITNIHISLSYEKDYAAAFAVSECGNGSGDINGSESEPSEAVFECGNGSEDINEPESERSESEVWMAAPQGAEDGIGGS